MIDKPILINKNDLRELIADLTNSDRSMQSKFWSSVQETLKEHTISLQEHTGSINELHTDIALIRQSLQRQEDNQNKILEQVLKTNGRVNNHENEINSTRGWIKGIRMMILIVATLSVTIFELRLSAITKLNSDTQEMLVSHVKNEKLTK